MIRGTSKIWSKTGPVDLLIITEMLQRIQEKYGISLVKYYLCQYGTQEKRLFEEKICHRYQMFRGFQCVFDFSIVL